MITFTRKELIANTFLDDESIDQILKNQEIVQRLKKDADSHHLIEQHWAKQFLGEDKE